MSPHLRRYAALFEVLGVFLVGGLVMSQLIRLSGIALKNPLTELTTHTTGSELITAARELLVLLIFQYAGYFALIVPIGWWYRRRGPSAYAHMIFDIPMTPMWQGMVVIALVVCSLFIWRRGLDIVRGILATGGWAPYWILALSGIACAVAGTCVRGLEYAGLSLVVLAVAFEALDLRSKWTRTEAETFAARE